MIDYTVRQVTSQEANAMVVENHYLHRKAHAMFSYGLFDGDEMIGCVIYGKPASPRVCESFCGPEESIKVLELTRLWIKDGTPKNTESYLIGRTLRMLPKDRDIIISYAEIGAGHVGTVYQATNWIYTGMSDRHIDWRLDGKHAAHPRHIFDEHGGINGAKAYYGDRLEKYERPRKHRYVYFNTSSKARKKELLVKLRHKIQPYPKKEEKTNELVQEPIQD